MSQLGSKNGALMPRYFFHIRTPSQLDVDIIGTDCGSDEEAVAEARQAAREIVAEWVMEQHRIDGEAFEVFNDTGILVATVTFKDVLLLH